MPVRNSGEWLQPLVTYDASPSATPAIVFQAGGRSYCAYREPAADAPVGVREQWAKLSKLGVGRAVFEGARYLIVAESALRSGVAAPGARRDGGERHPVDVLTQRELQIVALVARGRANKEIAARLRISEWTVSTHLRRIFAKLGVDSRAAMVFRCASLLGKSASTRDDVSFQP